MVAGLWPLIESGSPPAVTAGVCVSQRRAKLLGLDEPTATRTEHSGSLLLSAQTRLKAEIEELYWLTVPQLEALAAASDRLMADAIAQSKARRTPVISVSPSPVAAAEDVTGEPAVQPTAADTDQRDASGADAASPDTP